jgi:putative membrane protein
MIVAKRPPLVHAVRKVALPLAILSVWDILVTIIYFKVTPNVKPLELPLALFGTALALFIGFAVNAAYARWWEARGLWGLMINASRNLARQALTFDEARTAGSEQALGRQMARAQIAYVHMLRGALRGEPMAPEAEAYLTAEAAAPLDGVTNKPNMILLGHGALATRALKAGTMDAYARVRLETTLVDIANAQGGMERIRNTPLPSQYRFYPLVFTHVFCALLPFAVVNDLGLYTPLGSTLVSLMFLMALRIGLDLMDPFADDIYDVPTRALCRTIEIDLLQMMGEPAPAPMKPEHGVLR